MIYIEVLGIQWSPGRDLKLRKFRDFERWLAFEFVERIKLSIDTQRYLKRWPPLSLPYLDRKMQMGLSSNIWEATGQLKRAVTVKTGRLTVGFDRRIRHTNSDLPMVEIAKIVEFGSVVRNIPPRPLFRMVYRWLKSKLKFFYLRYLKEAGTDGSSTI